MTLIDVLNEQGCPTGDKKTKPEVHEQGLWHAAAHIWIYNFKGEILMQLRAKDKDSYPGLWDISAAGHVDSGETPQEAAIREVSEEIGLSVKPNNLEFVTKRSVSIQIPEISWQNNEIDFVYLCRFDGNIEELSTPDGEVEKLEFIPIKKFENQIYEPSLYKKYVPHGDYYQFVIDIIRQRMIEK